MDKWLFKGLGGHMSSLRARGAHDPSDTTWPHGLPKSQMATWPPKALDGHMSPEKIQVATGLLKGSHGPSKDQMATWDLKGPDNHMALKGSKFSYAPSKGQMGTWPFKGPNGKMEPSKGQIATWPLKWPNGYVAF
jgi:hypothetical protein